VGVQNACVRPRLRPTRVTAPPRPTVPRAPADTRAPEVVAARTRARRPVGGAIARRGARPGVASRFAGTVSSGNFQRLERTASGFKARSTGSRRGVFLLDGRFFLTRAFFTFSRFFLTREIFRQRSF
jgi:hypothetical protein